MSQAWEVPVLDLTFPCTSTGIKRQRFVNLSTAGKVIAPVVNGPVIGVVLDGTTESTRDPRAVSVRVLGVAKVSCTASTVGVGELIATSTNGSPKGAAAASYVAGRVVAGTSGAVNRVISVLVNPFSGSTALA